MDKKTGVRCEAEDCGWCYHKAAGERATPCVGLVKCPYIEWNIEGDKSNEDKD